MRCSLLWLTLVVACKSDAAEPPARPVDEPPPSKTAGVEPDRFECTSIVPAETLAALLGAAAHPLATATGMPRGLPPPCTYELETAPVEHWTYDFDCRADYKRRADALFAQYQQMNADRIAQYNRVADAGVKPTGDAGAEPRAPGTSAAVAVGAKGLDHNDQGLIFIDDDAPCYVRVVGPDAARRLELGKLIAKNLTYDNAPMGIRPARR